MSSCEQSGAMATIERIPLSDDVEAWLEARLHYINASEMPIVCGEAGYGSLAELYAEKKRLRPPLVDSGVLRRGRWGEASVFQALAEERPEWDVNRARVHVINRARRIACTPDGFAIAPGRDGMGVVQAKVVARSIFKAKWLDDPDDSLDGPATVPSNYRIQTVTERMLNADRCPWAVLAVLINGEFDWRLRLFDIEPDRELEERILDAAEHFLRAYLDPGIMPPFEPQRDEALVKALYPQDDGTEIDLTGDNRALVAAEELEETSAAIKRLKKTEHDLKTELEAKLCAHTYGRLADGRRLSWKMTSRKGYSVGPTTYRTLRILKSEDRAA
jgi:predicted phage-related endonuclease